VPVLAQSFEPVVVEVVLVLLEQVVDEFCSITGVLYSYLLQQQQKPHIINNKNARP
jgi:phosphoribosylamine-glycine ligase